MNRHDHSYNGCQHKFGYCEQCDVVYCTKCDREWGKPDKYLEDIEKAYPNKPYPYPFRKDLFCQELKDNDKLLCSHKA